MSTRKILPNEEGREPIPDVPGIETPDWDEIAAGDVTPPVEVDLELEETDEELPEEDDDNAYQESDEALPDDDEERAIRRDENGDGVPFDRR